MTDDSDRPTKRHTPVSALFPRILENPQKQTAEILDVLARHGRVMLSHTDQLTRHHERIKGLEGKDPVQVLHEIEDKFEEKVTKLDRDIIRLRTAVYVAAVIIGSGVAGSTAANSIKKDSGPPVQIQLPPEVLEALKH
jgi:hypothetical protein